uniref:Uncharacterized protein n=1 Tax=Arundo donax TaxID=35708 RepID=A0A0A9B004_ARUDO
MFTLKNALFLAPHEFGAYMKETILKLSPGAQSV